MAIEVLTKTVAAKSRLENVRCQESISRATDGDMAANPCVHVKASDLQTLEPKADMVAQLLTALGHSKRLMAMCRMMDEEVSVGTLAESVGLGQSALSQHLSKLRALGLVTTRREGQTIYYRLASEEARELIGTLYRLFCK
ncbi:MAG: ArsR family transcriptional regulator [Saliniramus fredricksonii]|uniref:ArsR family transcriptional regulator n=2 Tax=Saliniramus fredricksonii TaxID=1653334 RepID=A0A0P8A3Q4_9HYPH|nr:MAG: ArsR family transcriptional regulator [Saliniramus fredricksonii]SCC78697.1 DNA-binding transcriptional regulator, ArsR family [Saliniramus fredricksonii]